MRVGILGLSAVLGHVLQSADVYASFGVNSAVMSSSDPMEHEQNMLELNVATRDGDDSIDLVNPDDLTDETEGQNEEGGDQEGSEGDLEEGEEGGEFTPLGEPDEELTKASQQLDEYASGFEEMRNQAIKAGLPAEVASRIEAEYEADGKLSDDSYTELAKAGYSAGFVNSFLQGQEAVAEAYITKIVGYAGGKEQFDRVVAHLKANSPNSMDALYDAMERQDLNTVRTVINLGMASQTKKFGKQPERTLNRRGAAPAGRTAPTKVQGFESQNEMVKAMSDKRYGRDKAYTAEVETKVHNANW